MTAHLTAVICISCSLDTYITLTALFGDVAAAVAGVAAGAGRGAGPGRGLQPLHPGGPVPGRAEVGHYSRYRASRVELRTKVRESFTGPSP